MRATIVGVLIAALTSAVFAQDQTGAVEGVVVDLTAAPVAGASLAIEGAALIRPLETRSDRAGSYRFPSLPPGRYEVTATLAGFRRAAKAFAVQIGQIVRIQLTLRPGDRTEAVDVVAEPAILDVRQSAVSATLQGVWLHGLPRGRDVTSVVSVAPSAGFEARLGGVSMGGASGSENRWFVDGVDISSLQKGYPEKRQVTDFIDEVQVRSAGYAAEHGGALGGVVSAVTRSGTNDWRGEIGTYLSSHWLDAAPRLAVRINPLRDDEVQQIRDPEQQYATWEPGVTVSGPILPNRLWLFGSYMPTLRSNYSTVTFLSTGETRKFTAGHRTQHALANLTGQAGQRLRFKLGGHFAPWVIDGILPSPDGTGDPDERYSDFLYRFSSFAVSTQADLIASARLHFGLRGGYIKYNSRELNSPDVVRHRFERTNIDMPGIPADLQRPRGFTNVTSNSGTLRDIQSRATLHFDGAWWVNAHALKAGIQLERVANDVFRGFLKPNVRYYWGEAAPATDGRLVRGSYGYYRAYFAGTYGKVTGDSLALFLQDRWSVRDRLTLNLGLRFEKESIPSYRRDDGLPPSAIEFGFGDKVAPRVGFAWDVKGDGRLKAHGSWGFFYDNTKLELPRAFFGGDQWLDHFFTLDTYDWPSIASDPACPPRCPGTLIETIDRRIPANDPSDVRVDAALRAMRSRELVLGVERQLGKTSSLGVRYVRKRLDRAVENQGIFVPGLGEKYFITNPGIGLGRSLLGPEFPDQPKAVRNYDGLEIEFWRRLANGWGLHAGYVLSRLWGNYTGLVNADEGGRPSPNVHRAFDALAMSFQQDRRPSNGLLPTDRPHRLKGQAVRQFRWGTQLGVSGHLQSGEVVSRILDLGGSIPVYYRGRASDGRGPLTSSVDLYVQHELRLGGKRRLQISVNVINLFDQARPIYLYPRVLQSELALTSDDYMRGVDLERLIRDQGSLRDPRFLRPVAFQEPRTVRLGVRLLL